MFHSPVVGAPIVALISVFLVTACAGQVVVVDDDGSGGAGAGPGPGPGPGTGPGPGPDSSAECAQYCAVSQSCLPDCASDCEALFNGECDEQASAALVCLTAHACSTQGECQAELTNLNFCQSGICSTNTCKQDETSCACDGLCFGDVKIEQQCSSGPSPGGGAGGGGTGGGPPAQVCDCYLDGSYVGSCDAPGFACSIEAGCCQQFMNPQ